MSGGSSGGSSSSGGGSSSGSGGSSSGSGGSSSGSGGSSSGSGGSSSGSGGSSSGSGGSSSSSGGGRVPQNHRPDDSQCQQAASPGNCNFGGSSGGMMCSADSQCTAGTDGRCVASGGGVAFCQCTYDTCQHDADCGAGQTCACHGAPYGNGLGNTCTPSGCRVNADCGSGGYCSPADNTMSCGSLLGYFCHTPSDQCTDDSDCGTMGGYQVCTYSMSLGYWQCQMQGLCG